MKEILTTSYVDIPDNVSVEVSKRRIRVKGPRGTICRVFTHAALDISMMSKKKIRVEGWFKNHKEVSLVRTISSHIKNMIKGVLVGFLYKLRAVYAHFPINVTCAPSKGEVSVRNFLGEKKTQSVTMTEGVFVEATGTKDEIQVSGIDIEKVSQCAASIQQCTKVANGKDIRKFLDGIYVSERGNIGELKK
jgi:large subunit ribosomal protein L9e